MIISSVNILTPTFFNDLLICVCVCVCDYDCECALVAITGLLVHLQVLQGKEGGILHMMTT